MVVDFYKPGNTVLHRFDPRAKLLSLVVLVPCFFIPVPPWLALAYAAGLAVLVSATLGPRELGTALAAIGPLLLIICVLTPVFIRDGALLWSPFGIPVLTALGLSETMRIVARFAGLALTFFAVFRTLDMNDMILALRWFGLPFRVSLVLIVAFRFIPSLFALYRNVEDAHALRSGGAGRRGFFRHVLPVLTSVVIQAVRAIPALAMALETRGLGRKGARTAYRELRGGPGFVLSFAVLGLLAVVLFAPLMLLP